MWESREVSLNNPFNADSKITTAYTITLDTPIVIKPTKIDMDEHITTNDGDESIKYQRIEKDIINPNTNKCVLYNYGEILLDEYGNKKECKPIDDEKDEDKQKRCVKGEDGEWYEKNPNVNKTKYTKSLEGTCQKQSVLIYSTGVTFTPNYDDVNIDIPNQCKTGETPSYESVEEKIYQPPNIDDSDDENAKLPYETDDNGNAVLMTDGYSSYYKYIQSIKNDALNVNNYNKRITKLLCTADNDDLNKNAYIIGAVVNQYKATKNNGLTKLEVESLTNMNLTHHLRTGTACKNCSTFQKWKKYNYVEQWLTVTFSIKKNWANNQTIYEHEMYRPFRRPDGSVFYLYERQGFFTNEPKVDCADCARDDELNG